MDNPYETLGVAPDADERAIHKAYEALVKQLEADVEGDPRVADRLDRVEAAWQLLGDPLRRHRYDALFMDGSTDLHPTAPHEREVKTVSDADILAARPKPRQRTAYDVLGLARDVDQAEITGAYQALVEKLESEEGDESATLQEVHAAYRDIGDTFRRQRYDYLVMDATSREEETQKNMEILQEQEDRFMAKLAAKREARRKAREEDEARRLGRHVGPPRSAAPPPTPPAPAPEVNASSAPPPEKAPKAPVEPIPPPPASKVQHTARLPFQPSPAGGAEKPARVPPAPTSMGQHSEDMPFQPKPGSAAADSRTPPAPVSMGQHSEDMPFQPRPGSAAADGRTPPSPASMGQHSDDMPFQPRPGSAAADGRTPPAPASMGQHSDDMPFQPRPGSAAADGRTPPAPRSVGQHSDDMPFQPRAGATERPAAPAARDDHNPKNHTGQLSAGPGRHAPSAADRVIDGSSEGELLVADSETVIVRGTHTGDVVVADGGRLVIDGVVMGTVTVGKAALVLHGILRGDAVVDADAEWSGKGRHIGQRRDS